MNMRLSDPTAELPAATAAHLPDDPATLKRMIVELLASLHERDRSTGVGAVVPRQIDQCGASE